MKKKYGSSVARIPETKWYDADVNVETTSVDTMPIGLNPIGEGSDNNQRIGKQIRMKSLRVRLMCGNTVTQLDEADNYPMQANTFRVLIVNDKQANAGYSSISNVIATESGGGVFLNAYKSRNMAYLDRFDVLMDELVSVCASGPNAQLIDRYIKLDLPARYVDDTATFPITNALCLYFIDINQTTGNQGLIYGSVRLNYFDD